MGPLILALFEIIFFYTEEIPNKLSLHGIECATSEFFDFFVVFIVFWFCFFFCIFFSFLCPTFFSLFCLLRWSLDVVCAVFFTLCVLSLLWRLLVGPDSWNSTIGGSLPFILSWLFGMRLSSRNFSHFENGDRFFLTCGDCTSPSTSLDWIEMTAWAY